MCPVKLFALTADKSSDTTVEKNLDECTLCDLCINAAPAGSVKIVKLYE